jgi:hypothetical protein
VQIKADVLATSGTNFEAGIDAGVVAAQRNSFANLQAGQPAGGGASAALPQAQPQSPAAA